ncbi:MAG: MMPL family transporter [Pirellulales bacterium]
MTLRPTFLARTSLFGLPNYLLIALLAAVFIAMIPRGVRKAVESNTNKAEDWLPSTYAESIDLRWFREHFAGEQFVLVSWDGCTLGDTEKLELLVDKLLRQPAGSAEGERWFTRITTGPQLVETLMAPPGNLTRSEAIARLEGALIGQPKKNAAGESLGDDTRTTCFMAFMSPEVIGSNRRMREAIERIEQVAQSECGIATERIHMGGPPVDNVTIDKEGERTLYRLAGLAGVVGFGLCYWCFRSWKLALLVFSVAVLSAGMSLALVFYYGVFEVLVLGKAAPRYGTMDAILMSMPAVVYVLGLSGAIHLVNYYRDARFEHGVAGAAERAVKAGWWPTFLCAFTTAVGLFSLATSDIIPIKKFGIFTGIAVVVTVGILMAILPIALHRFPTLDDNRRKRAEQAGIPPWARRFSEFICDHHRGVFALVLIGLTFFALGLPRIQTSVQLLKLLDPETDLITDYIWLEEHLGHLVPIEIVVAVDPERTRSPDEHSETDGQAYRMSMFERVKMISRVGERIERLPAVSRALSAATFAPTDTEQPSASLRRRAEYTISTALEENREALEEYVQREHNPPAGAEPRELWRLSARITALADVDYGLFVHRLREEVEPVLDVYRWRDELVRHLHKEGQQLEGAQVCVLFEGPPAEADPAQGSQAALLVELLRESGARSGSRGGVTWLNAARVEALTAEQKQVIAKGLQQQDVAVALTPTAKEALAKLGVAAIPVLQVEPTLIVGGLDFAVAASAATEQPLPAVYTGVVPLVYKTQRELLVSLLQSVASSGFMIALIMMLAQRGIAAGLAAMLPNIFPIIIVFGGLGWLGIKVDMGIMMTASVALGVAVDDTIHYLTWFRRYIQQGMDARGATLEAFERCGTSMVQTAIVAGLGLSVFAASTFTPTRQFGYLMVVSLLAAVVGDLIMLPSILCGPIGRAFVRAAKKAPREDVDLDEPAASPAVPVAPVPAPHLPQVVAHKEPSELSSAHAELRAKLQKLRRESARD